MFQSLFGRLQPSNFSPYTTPDNDVERTRDYEYQGSWNRRHNHESNTFLYAATENEPQNKDIRDDNLSYVNCENDSLLKFW